MKRCVFLLNFSFEDDSGAAYAFSLPPESAAALGVPDTGARPEVESGYLDWLGETRAALEEQFRSVHDVSGTQDTDAVVDGFMLYESARSDAPHVAKAWHDAVTARLGAGHAVSELVSMSHAANEEGAEPAIVRADATATDIAEAVERLLSPVRRRPSP